LASRRRAMLAGVVAVAVGLIGLQATAGASPPQRSGLKKSAKLLSDNLPGPFTKKQQALRQEALKQAASGKADIQTRKGSKVVAVGKDRATGKTQYVELAREKTDKIFVVLAEFGNERHPDYPDLDPDDRDTPASTFDGPTHNQIAQPDRSKDNSNIWQADYNREHFQNMYFGKGRDSVAGYYDRQSSGRYTVEGYVGDWVKVQYNEARYGRNSCGGSSCNNTWELIKDGVNAWVAQQKAAGKTDEEIKTALGEYDEWDRYDFDGDGNFNEADGYIDHFQIVHAGTGEETGGGAQGEDAIWSHRWYAFATSIGQSGPENNLGGGAQIGETGIWVGDYTIQPENGGLGVFAHEYGHDLGLPDEYDTSGSGESPAGFWTLMASGSYLGPGDEHGIGTLPGDMNAWDKFQLGWLDYDTALAGQKSRHTLGPAEYNTKNPQAVIVNLPKKERTLTLAPPPEGKQARWSTQGNDLVSTMTRDVELPAGQKATLAFKAWYEIEADFDFGFVEVDDGSGWKTVKGNISSPNPDHNNGITGTSEDKWVDAAFDLSAYAGKTVKLRMRYQTDGGVSLRGLMADQIALDVDGTQVFADNAEDGDGGWTAEKFKATTGTEVSEHKTYYIAEARKNVSYDKGLRTGPYQFGFPQSKPDWVEHYPYQNGLLVSYWDTSFEDNNTGEHPGEGLILPIDSTPAPIALPDGSGKFWRTRVNMYDAPLRLTKTSAFGVHYNEIAQNFASHKGVATFDDTQKYWYEEAPDQGVKVPGHGVTITVLEEDGLITKVAVGTK
jgi:immune inhibitor A